MYETTSALLLTILLLFVVLPIIGVALFSLFGGFRNR